MARAASRQSPAQVHHQAPRRTETLTVKITLTVECSTQLLATLLALAGTTATLLASHGGGGLKNPAAAAMLMAGLLFGRLLSGSRPRD